MGEAPNYGVMSARAIPFFHVLSGSDTILSIFGKSKNTHVRWKLVPEITKRVVKLAAAQ